MASVRDAKGLPWYRHGYVWLVIAVPMSSVIVGIIMFTLATRSYDGLVGARWDFLENAALKADLGFGRREERDGAGVVSTNGYIRFAIQLAFVF